MTREQLLHDLRDTRDYNATLPVEKGSLYNPDGPAAATEIERLVSTLQEIADAHVPDQPATSPLSETQWLVQHIRNLRRAAADELERMVASELQSDDCGLCGRESGESHREDCPARETDGEYVG